MPRDVKVKEGQCFQGGTGLTSLALSLSGQGATEFVPSLNQKQIPQNRIERRHPRYPICK